MPKPHRAEGCNAAALTLPCIRGTTHRIHELELTRIIQRKKSHIMFGLQLSFYAKFTCQSEWLKKGSNLDAVLSLSLNGKVQERLNLSFHKCASEQSAPLPEFLGGSDLHQPTLA